MYVYTRIGKHQVQESDPARYLEVMQGFKEFVFPNVPGGYAYGWQYETFFIDMSVHLPWLEKILRKSGVNFVPVSASRFNRLDDLTFLEEEIIFNCTGLGAGKLCDDPSVYPIKGQVVLRCALLPTWTGQSAPTGSISTREKMTLYSAEQPSIVSTQIPMIQP